MNKRILLKYVLPLTSFLVSFGLIFLFLQWYRTDKQPTSAPVDKQEMTALSRGEVVTLPSLSRLGGGTVSLGSLPEKNLLVGFFSTSCPGCSKDSEFWRSLHDEATKRNVAFYLVAIDKDQEDVKKFAQAYGFDDLPVLVDRTGAVVKEFDVTNVPMYVLLTSEGQVREWWVGLSHTNADDQRAKEPAQFFPNL